MRARNLSLSGSKSSLMEPHEKMKILRKIDLFRFFHDSTLERLAQESPEVSVQADTVLFREGDPGKAMYVVLKGEILIYRGEQTLATLSDGTFFGEMSVIESRPRNASAKTRASTLLLEISEIQFQKYFATQPQALMAIMKTLSARSRSISNNLINSHAAHEPSGENPIPGDEKEGNPGDLVLDAESYRFLQADHLIFHELGYTPAEVEKMSFLDLAFQLDAQTLEQRLNPLKSGAQPVVRIDTLFRRKNGSIYPVGCKFQKRNSGHDGQLQLWFQDITEKEQMENTIRQMAYYDSLTGLPNRNLLNDRLAVALAHATRHSQKVALMFLDLDHFKTINDSLGHESGDKLLQQVAHRIKNLLRREDTVARMGGDEFIVLAPGIHHVKDAAMLAEKLLHILSVPFKVSDNEFYLGGSIGISLFPDDGTEIHTLLKNADLALYRAKDKGRNTFELFTPSMNSRAVERLAIERSLRKGMDGNEFELHYQPKVDLQTGAITGVEALIRWENPGLGRIMPNQFIPVAEETRLIVPLGNWILRTACRQLRAWSEARLPKISMAVNLSVIQFHNPGLVDEIREVVTDSGIDPSLLELEITESFLLKDTHQSIATLRQLSELGIKIAIDDFGTGYSSLNYLKNLPIDYLKIDRTFVKDYNLKSNAAITRAIVTLAQSLGMKTIAEGVETEAQRHFLETLHCDEAQGYLFSPPQPNDTLMSFLKENRNFK